MKRIFNPFILALLTLLPATAFAHDFEVDGIYYNINGTEATVTFKGTNSWDYDNEYTGSVNIPATVTYGGTTYSITTIGHGAFYNCSQLTSVNIPNSVTTINTAAFKYCTGLTSIDIPNSVRNEIGPEAFEGCTGLISAKIGNSVTKIRGWVFYGCTELTSVIIGSSVTTINSQAFYGCTKLSNITIPNSVTLIGSQAFDGTTWYNNQPNGLVYAGLVAYKYKGHMPFDTQTLIIRDGTLGIADDAFTGGLGHFITITIPNSVTTIGNRAFCNGYCSVNIPNSVKYIGSQAFYGIGQYSITIPSSVTYIGNAAFAGNSGLTSIIVESGNPNYDSRNNCNAIIETASNTLITGCMNTTIPNSVTAIGNDAFYECSRLTSIDIPNSVTTIGNNAFYYCSGLTSVTIPNSVTTIGPSAFSGCSGLNSVTIGNSVMTIGELAFSGCSGLTSVTCLAVTPPAMKHYYQNYPAFSSEVTNQATLYVPWGSVAAYQAADNWKDFSQIVGIFVINDFEVDGVWYRAMDENTAMVIQRHGEDDYYQGDVVIPDAVTYEDVTFSVTAIDAGAFEDCYELNSVVIGDAVETIGENAFQGCTDLTSVTIGSGVTSIGAKAFNYCNALQTVTCRGTVPPMMASSNCFTNAAYSRAVLKVPRPEIETYAAAVYWYKFNHIEGWGYLGPGDVNGDGVVGMDDLTRLINILVTDDLGGTDPTWADVNGNGMVNMNDLTALINLLVFGHL